MGTKPTPEQVRMLKMHNQKVPKTEAEAGRILHPQDCRKHSVEDATLRGK